MIRKAKFSDIPRIIWILADAFERSIYSGRGKMSAQTARTLLEGGVSSHVQNKAGVGAACVFVAEIGGEVQGFIYGILDRVYHIGDKLMATDFFWVPTEDCPTTESLALFDAFVAWAEGNPAVVEITPAATNAIGDWRGAELVFKRRGFVQRGVIYERRLK